MKHLEWLAFLAVLPSCAARADGGASRIQRVEGSDLFERARAAFVAGDESTRLLREFTQRFPDDPRSADAEMWTGLIGAAREDWPAAARHFAAAAKNDPSRATARLLQALVEQRPAQSLCDADFFKKSLAAIRASLAPADVDAGAKAVAPVDERGQARALLKLCALSRDDAKRLAEILPKGVARRLALLQAAGLAKAQGALKEARLLLEGARETGDDEVSKEASAQIEAIDAVLAARRVVIGVILPLSGRAKDLGERALAGIQLAAEEMVKEPLTLVTRDTGGDEKRAVGELRTLAEKEAITAAIGPMLLGETKAAATFAQKIAVPIVVLSPRHAITEIGDNVFRLFSTARREVETLAEHAVRVEGRKRFGVVHTESAYGKGVARLFAEAVARRGAKVVADVGIALDQSDFRADAKTLKSAAVDAVFLAEPPKTAVPILPFLAKAKLPLVATLKPRSRTRPLLLLAGPSWHSEAVVSLGGQLVEGAVVVATFLSERAADFTARFRARWQREAGDVEAFAYDAFSVLHHVVFREKARDRDEIREALTKGAADRPSGVTGALRFAASRELAVPLALLRVSNGVLKPMSP